jgi:hypothetical protein
MYNKEKLDRLNALVDGFNNRFGAHLEEGHYGMAIMDEEVIAYMTDEFEKEIEHNPGFEFAQIKLKFGTSRVYTKSDKSPEWEEHIDFILRSRKNHGSE